MPKERRDRSWSHDYSRLSPFPSSGSSKSGKKRSASVVFSKSEEDLKEWEEARCSVCMEHPHNAVLLICTSHEKGCRPYMCDTSYRHSNCLDQFCKASGAQKSPVTTSEMITFHTGRRTTPLINVVGNRDRGQAQVEGSQDGLPTLVQCDGEEEQKISCPLCRGQVTGWIVVDAARQFMNAKTRICSRESCPFSGNYADLRKHARSDHPLARPSEVDQERQRNWRRLERQRDLGDVLSSLRSSLVESRVGSDDDSQEVEGRGRGGFVTVYFFVRITGNGPIDVYTNRQRNMILWGESLDDGEAHPTEEDDVDEVVDESGGSWRHM